ncbi:MULTISPECIES: sugar-binding domain-containing protein [Chitinophagaceae]
MKIFGTVVLLIVFFLMGLRYTHAQVRERRPFNDGWLFWQPDTVDAPPDTIGFGNWKSVRVPHDWSIEQPFSNTYPTSSNQGALPAGIGWYAKTFKLPEKDRNKVIGIDFDGIYRNSEVWINGHYLGIRPNGYISFQYDLSPYLRWDGADNKILVKVDNHAQPESRWYTGSGIYRNVWLSVTNKMAIAHWGTFVQTDVTQSENNKLNATVHVKTSIRNFSTASQQVHIDNIVLDNQGHKVANKTTTIQLSTHPINVEDDRNMASNTINISNPALWSPASPTLYTMQTIVTNDKGELLDSTSISFGIRHIYFDGEKGFYLNFKPLKILGVCLHHDLGALGAAVNTRAIERQLQLLKDMGCNAIRTSHNAPAPELLDLCDKMGFMVMDEFFDMWAKKKNKYDYHLDFDKWYRRDLTDQVLRDRNHPSIMMWSIGNEIREQFDTSGIRIARTLAGLVKGLDTSRPIVSALTEMDTSKNYIYQSRALDVLGWNYNEKMYPDFLQKYPGQKFVASETVSALESRGHYDMPSDSVMFWPASSKEKYVQNGNADYTVSAYDQVAAYWGSTHEATWKIIKKYPFLSGEFVWTGFDYLGEPTPYPYPARSSYFGIIDLAGFPKDVYYMYQSEWSDKKVLHIFPHWNWTDKKVVDVWAYYNNADEIELYLNGKSLGKKRKVGDELHVQWRVPFQAGILKAITRKNGKTVLIQERRTAGAPAKIKLSADRKMLTADGRDLSFVTVQVVDKDNNIVPNADNIVKFSIAGAGFIAGTDNGNQADTICMKSPIRKVFNGLGLVIVQSSGGKGAIRLKVDSKGLKSEEITLLSQ